MIAISAVSRHSSRSVVPLRIDFAHKVRGCPVGVGAEFIERERGRRAGHRLGPLLGHKEGGEGRGDLILMARHEAVESHAVDTVHCWSLNDQDTHRAPFR